MTVRVSLPSLTDHFVSCHESQFPTCASPGNKSTRLLSTNSNARTRPVLLVWLRG